MERLTHSSKVTLFTVPKLVYNLEGNKRQASILVVGVLCIMSKGNFLLSHIYLTSLERTVKDPRCRTVSRLSWKVAGRNSETDPEMLSVGWQWVDWWDPGRGSTEECIQGWTMEPGLGGTRKYIPCMLVSLFLDKGCGAITSYRLVA